MTASARNDVAFDGIGYDGVTLKFGNTLSYDATQPNGIPAAVVGRAITLGASKTAQLAADGEPVFGKLLVVKDDGFCGVQYEGICTLPGGNGATLTPGSKIVGALDASNNKGFIRSVATDTVAHETAGAGRIVDATDATAVAVDLD